MFVREVCFLVAAFLPLAMQAQSQPQRDECDLSTPGVCVRHVLQDEGAILTSPLHARASDLLWIAPFGLATGVAIDYDAHALRTLGYHPKQQNTFDQISNAGAVYLPIAAIAAGMPRAHGARTIIFSRPRCFPRGDPRRANHQSAAEIRSESADA